MKELKEEIKKTNLLIGGLSEQLSHLCARFADENAIFSKGQTVEYLPKYGTKWRKGKIEIITYKPNKDSIYYHVRPLTKNGQESKRLVVYSDFVKEEFIRLCQ